MARRFFLNVKFSVFRCILWVVGTLQGGKGRKPSTRAGDETSEPKRLNWLERIELAIIELIADYERLTECWPGKK